MDSARGQTRMSRAAFRIASRPMLSLDFDPRASALPEAGGDDPGVEGFAAFVRGRLQPAVRELGAEVEGLAAGLGEEPAPFGQDLARMRAAAVNLAASTAELETRLGDDPSPELGLDIRKLRHDLRTPITSILGYGELVAEEAAETGAAALAERLETVIADAQRLLGTLDTLSAFVRPERAGPPSETAPAGKTGDIVGIIPAPSRDPAAEIVQGHILVVDDNPAMRDLIERRLTRQGHAVTVRGSGEEALARIAEGGIDLMMLDLLMPGIDGLEVLRRLKAGAGATPLPVIVMSALNEAEAAVRCIEAGADDYLSKPLDETLLRARIGSSLERKFLRDRERRTLDLLRAERERSEMLLRNILPGSVVERLHAGESVVADAFDDVTVMFCDLVGFTSLAARLGTTETLQLLEDIFSRFDALADRHGLEKIKTIGDAYMVVGGIPDPLADSAARVLAMAAAMAGEVRATKHGTALGIRIGIDTGPAAGGIVGTKKFFYDVWGDTVNTASRLESTCEPGRIHVSQAVAEAAGAGFSFERRAPIDLAGKGRMQTFYLAGLNR
ncbi:two-component hybrid sensor and regulator [Aureimonas endophytica]|uniref:histidine kinase n=1 Tax=Aureimonas endophytica TaxID=2027858 RepID=A0A916ZTY5_9HYPH|nr:adenylate/guanylate cyclase domain-containing protein [Aureimonas endophytica]GGE12565.1 two-component hybrid sensor and regulator [Aureimonas endophytica]